MNQRCGDHLEPVIVGNQAHSLDGARVTMTRASVRTSGTSVLARDQSGQRSLREVGPSDDASLRQQPFVVGLACGAEWNCFHYLDSIGEH